MEAWLGGLCGAKVCVGNCQVEEGRAGLRGHVSIDDCDTTYIYFVAGRSSAMNV